MPHDFYGSVTVRDGEPAPAGTRVEARVPGVIPGDQNPLTVTVPGQYGEGLSQFAPRNLVVSGYIENDAPIEFYVDGIKAEVYDVNSSGPWTGSYPFHAGRSTQLNLRTNLTAPKTDFAATPAYGKEPLVVQFTDTTIGYPTKWLWDFGDGTSSDLQNPVHRYMYGTYTVSLSTWNAAGSNNITKANFISVTSSAGGGGGGGGEGAAVAEATLPHPPRPTRPQPRPPLPAPR